MYQMCLVFQVDQMCQSTEIGTVKMWQKFKNEKQKRNEMMKTQRNDNKNVVKR
jgi:hypothetical protein